MKRKVFKKESQGFSTTSAEAKDKARVDKHEGSCESEDEAVDPNHIIFEMLITQTNTQVGFGLPQLAAQAQAQARLQMPTVGPAPLEIADDDLPQCDSSGQAQITVSSQPSLQNSARDTLNNDLMAQGRQLQLMTMQQVEACQEEEENDGPQPHENLAIDIPANNMKQEVCLENLLLNPATTEKFDEAQMQPPSRKKDQFKFTEMFPKLNEQAIELLVRQSEPETALDLLRQALSELNNEKRVSDGMPAYRHQLLHREGSQVPLAHSNSQKRISQQVQPHYKTIEQAMQSGSLTTKNSKLKKVSASPSRVKAQKIGAGARGSKNTQQQSLLQVQSKDRNGRDARSHIAVLSPRQVRQQQLLQSGSKNTAPSVTPFEETALGTASLRQKPFGYPSQQAKAALRGGGQSTKCASSNSTCEPSSNLIASSIKSSLITTPTTPNLAALTQTDLKEKTRESNLIVCLYYNLACCYQRLGLLEEAVEYLELASDQLEDTVQYFQVQEDSLIKQRNKLHSQQHQNQYQKQNQHQHQQQQHSAVQKPLLISQYATEQPQRSTKLDQNSTGQSVEYGSRQAQGLKNAALAQPQLLKTLHKKQRQNSAEPLNAPPKAANHSQLAKKQKVLKRDKISIKDCSAPPVFGEQDFESGGAAQHLSSLLKQSQLTAELANGGLMTRKHLAATKLKTKKQQQDFADACDHMLILHHSAEQLEHTKTSSMLPPKSQNQLQFASFTNNYSSLVEKHSSSGRNVSPVTSNSVPPDSSTTGVRLTGTGDPNSLITVEQLLAEKMHKSRYQCKMNLQICALQSQLGKHQDALIFGRRAAQICYKLIKNAQMLCKRYVAQIQRHIRARQTKSLRDQYGNTLPTQPDQASLGDSPNPKRIQKAQTEINDSFEDDYQAAQFSRRAPTKMDGANNALNTSNYSLSTGRYAQKVPGTAGNKQGAQAASTNSVGSKRPKSSCSSSRSSNTSNNNGLTRLRLSRGSLAKILPSMKDRSRRPDQFIDAGSRSSRESSHLGTASHRDSSTESLDRIHTFNLKNSQANYAVQRQSQSVSEAQPTGPFMDPKQQQQHAGSIYQHRGPETSSATQVASGAQPFESYNGLKVAIVDGVIPQPLPSSKHVRPSDESKVATSLQKYVQEADLFEEQNQNQHQKGYDSHTAYQTNQQQSTMRNVYVEESVKVLESLIIQADPLLQQLASIVKEFEDKSQKAAIDRDQEMIKKYGQQDFKDRRRRLKISFTSLQDLLSLERDQRFKLNVRNSLGVKNSQDWIFNLNIGNVMHLNMMREQELNAKIENTHELTKDTMLEKVVLITSAYFCVATEIRFILQKDLLDVKLITKKDSEAFHAKALHIALLFLPEDCPLSQYIHQTYCKNYLQPKLKLQKQRNAYLSQKLSKQHQNRQKLLAQTLADKDSSHQKQQSQNQNWNQQGGNRRPQTSLTLNKECAERIATKLLISTRSQEGLLPHANLIAQEIQTPVLGSCGSGIPVSAAAVGLPPKTSTAGATKSAQQAAQLRKNGATPDLAIKSKVGGSQQKKTGVATLSALRSQATLKQARPSLPVQTKKLKRQSVGSSTLLKAQHAQRASKMATGRDDNGADERAQASYKGLGLWGSSPEHRGTTSLLQAQANAVQKLRVRSPPATQASTAGAARQRDGLSVRKIKINLGQLASPEHHFSVATQASQTQHQRSSSLKRQAQQKSGQNLQASYGFAPPTTCTTGQANSINLNGKKTSSSATSSASHGKQRHSQNSNSIPKPIQSLQVKQSMGDCSNSAASLANNNSVSVASSQLAMGTRSLATGPSSNLRSPPACSQQKQRQQIQIQQPCQKQGPGGASLASQSSDASKQQAIMMAALKHLQSRAQLSHSSAAAAKKHR